MLVISKARTEQVARLVLGSLLLLPALLGFGLVFWFPALRTLSLSLQAVALERAGRFCGLANYAALAQDPFFWAALGRSVLVALVRLVASVTIPVLAGRAWRRQGPLLRLLGRLALCLGLAFSNPAALGLLWREAVPRVGALRALAGSGGTPSLTGYLALEFVAFLGVGGGLTALALLLVRPGCDRALRGVVTLAAMAALVSGLNAFSLPFALGGGNRGQATLALYLFGIAFQQFHAGHAAAGAVLLMIISLALGTGFALACEQFGLRFVPARHEEPRKPTSTGLLGGLGIALTVLPLLLLGLWGAGRAFLYPGQPLTRAASALAAELALLNGNIAPIIALALVQLPAAYLAALSLSIVRPFGRRGSSLAFVALVASGFVPPVACALGLYAPLRSLRLFNTLPTGGLHLMAGAAGLVLFRLYFAGQASPEPATGRPGIGFYPHHIIRRSLPFGVLAVASSLLLAGQCFLWPLVMLADRNLFPLSLALLVDQRKLAEEPALLAAGAWLTLTCWALGMLLLWWPLQATLLERVELQAPPRRR